MQHLCPKCFGPTYPSTPPVGNTAAHTRSCRNCGHVYTFDPDAVNQVDANADAHLDAVKSRGKRKGKKNGDSREA